MPEFSKGQPEAMRRLACAQLWILPCVWLLTSVPAARAEEDHPVDLVVGTKESPPFAFRDGAGRWTGISIELWEHLAEQLGLKFQYRELPLDALLEQLHGGRIDAAVAAISVTADRIERVEFCHPHYTTGLGIAVVAEPDSSGLLALRRVLSLRLVLFIAAVVSGVLGCGVLFWALERRVNTTHFGSKRQGIGLGVWWATILFLGHKGVVPVSVLGRLLAGSAMIGSILLFSLLTGVIASALTLGQLDFGITRPDDLRHVKTATVSYSTSADFLRSRRIPFRAFATAPEAFGAIVEGQVDALVYDAALLKYRAHADLRGRVEVLPITFHIQEYAIALQPDSPLRKPLNEALLRFRGSDAWEELLVRYLGEGAG